MVTDFTTKTKALIDELKAVCANYGLGNDGNEYKIITQAFLYKFLNDKFAHEVKQLDPKLAKAEDWEAVLATYSDKDFAKLLHRLGADCARLQRDHTLTHLFHQQNKAEFAKRFDDTLRAIASLNSDIFSVRDVSGARTLLFEGISDYISSPSDRDPFCIAIVNKLVRFSFESVVGKGFDFFAGIFEHLIKDYNKDGGGKYAEYYTPHAIAKIMAAILVDGTVKNVTCYDPAAGTGQLLMSLAHTIGQDRCTVYAQDINQKSSTMLRLNLVLNNLVHSIHNMVRGNTILQPYNGSDWPEKFDYIVSNPPFKLDFSDYREDLETNTNKDRFFAGIPMVPNKDKDKMAIYLLFIQHIMHMLGPKGKASVVVPTGFLTAKNGIGLKVLKALVDRRMLRGVVSMPSNIFATTGTNVSVLFLDKSNKSGNILLMDASKMGETIKEGKKERTILSSDEESMIIDSFLAGEDIEGFTVVKSYEDIKAKKYALSAGMYFDPKLVYDELTAEAFQKKVQAHETVLAGLFEDSLTLRKGISTQLARLRHGH